MTKKYKLLTVLSHGEKLTVKQAVKRCGFASKNSLTGTISDLRDAGFDIRGDYIRNARGVEHYKYFFAA